MTRRTLLSGAMGAAPAGRGLSRLFGRAPEAKESRRHDSFLSDDERKRRARVRYIRPAGSGNRSGTDWHNAARLTDINEMIRLVGPGGTVYLLAGTGPYPTTGPITISHGGAAGHPVKITGIDSGGAPARAHITGTRTRPYPTSAAAFAVMNPGNEVFRLNAGADHLHCLADRWLVPDDCAKLAPEREERGDPRHRFRGRGILLHGAAKRSGDGRVAAGDPLQELAREPASFGVAGGVVAVAPRVRPARLQLRNPAVVGRRAGLVVGAPLRASLTAPRTVPIMAYTDEDREQGFRCAPCGGRGKPMTAPTTQEFTVQLPEDVIEMLRRAARERRETPDAIVAEALRFSLQPVRQEALQRLKGHIQQQQAQSEPEIRAHLEARLTGAEQDRLSQLLERNRTQPLTPEEQAEMQALFDRIEAVATEKAAAIWLLSGQPPASDAAR